MKSGDYLKIPERIDNIVPVQLSPKVMEKYRQLERDLLLPLDGKKHKQISWSGCEHGERKVKADATETKNYLQLPRMPDINL